MTFLTNEQQRLFKDRISEEYARIMFELNEYIKLKQKEAEYRANWDEIMRQLKQDQISFSNNKTQEIKDKIIAITEKHPDYKYITSEETLHEHYCTTNGKM